LKEYKKEVRIRNRRKSKKHGTGEKTKSMEPMKNKKHENGEKTKSAKQG